MEWNWWKCCDGTDTEFKQFRVPRNEFERKNGKNLQIRVFLPHFFALSRVSFRKTKTWLCSEFVVLLVLCAILWRVGMKRVYAGLFVRGMARHGKMTRKESFFVDQYCDGAQNTICVAWTPRKMGSDEGEKSKPRNGAIIIGEFDSRRRSELPRGSDFPIWPSAVKAIFCGTQVTTETDRIP